MKRENTIRRWVYALTEDEVREHPFITEEGAAFYRYVVEKITGASYDDIIGIDCRQINVAENILKSWYEYAKENDISLLELTTLLALFGPKCNNNLANNRIEIYPRCIEIKEGIFFEASQESSKDAA